jgi:hypothetical protein
MGQDLSVNIKTTSDVPQAMDRAKSATVSFSKQVEDVQKKFSTAFKDIFLSFLGPLALLGIAMNYIGKLIDENRKKHEDANQAAIDGTNALMSAEDRYYANKRNNEKKGKEAVEEAKTSRADITKDFLLNDPRGRAILEKELDPSGSRPGFLKPFGNRSNEAGVLAENERVQAAVQALIARDIKDKPIAMAGKDQNFKGPEGFSNVVGVGANPVIEAMSAQLEEAQKQTALLQQIASKGTDTQTDFTKDSK